MVVLRKIAGATLIEALAAVLIIVTIFMIASLSLQNVFVTGIKNNDQQLRNRTKELLYLQEHGQLTLPFSEDSKDWEIYISNNQKGVLFETTHKKSNAKKIITLSK